MNTKCSFVLAIVLFAVVCCAPKLAFAGSLVAWGDNSYGQCDVPAGNDFVAMAAGYDYSLALRSGGSLVAWGDNWQHQCNVPAGNDFVAIGAGALHGLAVKSDGSLAAWGYNYYGQCDVPTGNDFISVAGGDGYSVALKSDGSLVGWGDNLYSQTDVPAGNDFVAIAATWFHAFALKSDGSLVVWGDNDTGLHDVPAGNDFVDIAASPNHSLALKSDGSLVAWGWNFYGQCDVPAGNDFIAVAGGGYGYNLALKSDRSLVAWGDNSSNQCDVPAGTDFVGIAAGVNHGLALTRGPVIYYVDADANGANDGSRWCDAFNYLQDALAVAQDGDEIRVAEGIYRPDEDTIHPNGTAERTATFQLKNGVAIKGSYAGCGEPDPNERDLERYETILSGDLYDNDPQHLRREDLLSDPCRVENCYHVITAKDTDSTAELDGFTITGGYANEDYPSPHGRGGGMCNYDGSPTLTNCTFTGNLAWYGGGMYNLDGSPKLTKCVFTKNVAHQHGGGMRNYVGSPTLINCAFSSNTAGTGGGMFNYPSEPELINCTFSSNSASDGGGMYNYNGSPTLANCRFTGNSANHRGGGLRNYGYHGNCNLRLTNCTFAGNSATNGNALACDSSESPSNVQFTNCILWDGGDEICNNDGSTIDITYSDVQGGWPGEGNINADPLFVDAANGDYQLSPYSPCIDSGDPNYKAEPNETDLKGNPRIVDGNNDGNSIVDMGAYEANYIEVAMKFTPQALNPGSKGKWVKAHFVLPEGFDIEDVDANTPAKLWPFGIESDYINVFINEDGLVEIEASFSRSTFCAAATDDNATEVTTIGLLTSGQYFYGTDTIRIITNNFKYLAILASHWLEAECGKPDWCGGADLDQDSLVNFVDFALFDGCCIEVVKD